MAEPSVEIVRRAQAGDADALVSLVESQQRYVYSIAMGIMRNPADAADMTQEAFVKLLRALHTYRFETKLTTWLYRLTTNVCVDGLRRRGRPVDSLELALEEGGEAREPADQDAAAEPGLDVERREAADELRAALDRLPVAQRLALTLYYFEDARYEDVAATMNLPLNTVKSHIRRGKARLAEILRENDDGPSGRVRSVSGETHRGSDEKEWMQCGAMS
jgi:RNA polymerase sigma-70 factor (ECF subfamily)